MGSGAVWSWEYEDEDEEWCARRTPEADAGTVRAVETLALSFGDRAWAVRDALEVWRRRCAEEGVGYGASTQSAALELVGEHEVEIQDMYGQFEDVVMDRDEFEDMLEALARAMTERDPASAAP